MPPGYLLGGFVLNIRLSKFGGYVIIHTISGCGAVRLARAVRVGEVVGSNPSIPTIQPPTRNSRWRFDLGQYRRPPTADHRPPLPCGDSTPAARTVI